MPTDTSALLAEYLREPRRVRRAVSRDLARRYPIPPRPASGGIVGERVRARRKMRHNVVHPIGGTGRPKSGQARINAKRNQRAAFWEARALVLDDLAAKYGWTAEQAKSVPPRLRQHMANLPVLV
jgi:hypothetical protein